jgi:hypothetical protein
MGIPASNGIDAAGTPNLGDQANAVLSGVITGLGPTAPFAFRGPMNFELFASINTALTTTLGSLNATIGSATGLAAGVAINSANVVPGTTVKTIAGTNITLGIPPLTIFGTIDANGVITLPPPSGPVGFATQLLGATVTIPSNSYGVTLPAGTTVAAVVQNDVPSTNIYAGVPAIIRLSVPPTALPVNQGQIPFQFAPTGNAIAVTGADAAATFTGAAVTFSATINIERSFDAGRTWIVCNIGGTGTLAQYTAGPISLTFGEPEKNVLYRLNCIVYASGTINYRFSQTGGAAESLAIGPLSGG